MLAMQQSVRRFGSIWALERGMEGDLGELVQCHSQVVSPILSSMLIKPDAKKQTPNYIFP